MLVDLGGSGGAPVALVLAQDPAPPPGKGAEFGKASPIGLVVIVLLVVATVLLVRSMNKHLRKVPASLRRARRTPSPASGPHVAADAPGPTQPAATPTGGDEPGDAAVRADGGPARGL